MSVTSSIAVVAPEVFSVSSEIRDLLDNLRSWLSKQMHLPNIEDQRLFSFLHSCNYSLEATKKCIDIYHTFLSDWPEIFAGRDILAADLQHMSKVIQVVTLSSKSPEGYMYVMTRFVNPDPDVYLAEAAIKLGFMVMDAALRFTPVVPGIIAIQDMRGLQFAHMTKLDFMSMRKQVLYVEQAMPVKAKSIHAIHTSPVVYNIFNFFKPLITKEHIKKINFHSGDDGLGGLDAFVPRSILPRDYGGDDLSMDELFARSLDQLTSYRDWFKEQEDHCRVDESKRQGKMRRESDVFGQEGSFKKLNFD